MQAEGRHGGPIRGVCYYGIVPLQTAHCRHYRGGHFSAPSGPSSCLACLSPSPTPALCHVVSGWLIFTLLRWCRQILDIPDGHRAPAPVQRCSSGSQSEPSPGPLDPSLLSPSLSPCQLNLSPSSPSPMGEPGESRLPPPLAQPPIHGRCIALPSCGVLSLRIERWPNNAETLACTQRTASQVSLCVEIKR